MQQEREQIIEQEKLRRHKEEEYKMARNAMVQEQRKPTGAIYSWRSEKGYRVYSNIGFPKDENYSDPKIEWK